MNQENIKYHNYENCPYCGEPVLKTNRKCDLCGRKLYSIVEENNPTNQENKNNFLDNYINKIKQDIREGRLQSNIKKILISFLLINIFFFSINIYKNAYNKPNAEARAYLTSARAVNYVYIFSLSDIFGYKNILTLPFYPLRDALYNKGMSLIPTNDGEREMWWWEIRFMEFSKYVMNQRYGSHTINKTPYLEQYLGFKKWEEEVYSHIEPLAKADLSNTEYSKEKYVRFITTIDSYTSFSTAVFNWLEKLDKKGYGQEMLYKYQNIYQVYENYKKYAQKNEQVGFDYFNNDPETKVNEYLYIRETSYWILYQLIQKNTLTCNNKFIDIYADNQFNIYDYFEKYHKTMSRGRFIQLSIAKTLFQGLEPIEIQCPKKIQFKKFVEMRNKEVNSNIHY